MNTICPIRALMLVVAVMTALLCLGYKIPTDPDYAVAWFLAGIANVHGGVVLWMAQYNQSKPRSLFPGR